MKHVERVAQLLETARVTPEEREALMAILDALDAADSAITYLWPFVRFTLGRRRFNELRRMFQEVYRVER